jgi:uncharacterized protein YndB with AHSA1/START domain
MDIAEQINAIGREVRGTTVLVRRGYAADIGGVWQACTDPERLGRWFLPVIGDLRLGGRYQLKDNAGGEILRCEPPRGFLVSWVFGEAPASYVELRLSPAGDGTTVLELEHSGIGDPGQWAQFGPGAVGVGWDLTVLGLGFHLSGGAMEDPEAREFMTRSSREWGIAHEASGADRAQACAAAERTAAFYVPTTQ